jgi:predicted DNA-binding transcriptional regulator AlpA
MKRRALTDASTRRELASPTPDPSPNGKPPDDTIGRLALRLDEVAATVGVSRSAIERERRAGRFPKPDRIVGRMPLWRPESIRDWLERGDR